MADETAPTEGTGETNNSQNQEAGSAFVAITSQDDFDKAIQARIARERAKFADYDQLKSAAAKLADIEEAQKTESQKLLDRITAAEKKVADAEQRAKDAETKSLRSDIATKFGISAEDRDLFLTGNDEATITAQAKRLADREVDRKKQGNVAPKEGATKNNGDGSDRELREFARNLFANTD